MRVLMLANPDSKISIYEIDIYAMSGHVFWGQPLPRTLYRDDFEHVLCGSLIAMFSQTMISQDRW